MSSLVAEPTLDRFESWLTQIGCWVLAAAFFALPLNGLRPVDTLSYGDVFLLIVFGIALLLIVIRRQLPQVPLWLWAGAAALALSAVVANAFSPANIAEVEASFPDVPEASALVECSKLLVGMAVLPVAAATILRSWKSIDLLVSAWIVGVAVSSVTAVSDAYLGTDLQLFFAYDLDSLIGFFVIEPARSMGLTVHSNTLSLTAVMATSLVVARMTSFRNVLMFYPVLLLYLVAILLSGARTGLVGVVVAVVLTLALIPGVRRTVFSRDYRIAITLVAGLTATAVMVLGLSIQPSDRAADYFIDQAALSSSVLPPSPQESPFVAVRLTEDSADSAPPAISRFGAGDDSAAASDRARRQYLEDSIRFIGERPLIGYGFRWIESSHSIYLQLLLAGGILAFVGFLTIAVGYLKTGYGLRVSVPESSAATASAITVSFAMMLIMGLVGNWILDRYLYLPVALIFAMHMISMRSRDRAEVSSVGATVRTGPSGAIEL